MADFSADTPQGEVGLTVNFMDQSDPGSQPITTWNWDLGDGEVSTEQSPSHTYTEIGAYTVSLTVTTSEGMSTVTLTNFVVVGAADVDVTLVAEEDMILIPGAEIFVRGESTQGVAIAEPDELVGVFMDGEAYFYLPTLGDVVLTDDMSSIAIWVWIAEFGDVQAASSAKQEEQEEIGTGLTAIRDEARQIYTLENTLNRWNAVKAPADPQEVVYFRPVTRWFSGLSSAFAARVPSLIVAGQREVRFDEQPLESFGSTFHLNVLNRVTPLRFGPVLETAQSGLDRDPNLVGRLYELETASVIAVAFANISQLVALECIDILFQAIADVYEADRVRALVGGDNVVLDEILRDLRNRLLANAVTCLSTLAGPQVELINTFMDSLATLGTVANAVSAFIQVATHDAYAIFNQVDIVGIWRANHDVIDASFVFREDGTFTLLDVGGVVPPGEVIEGTYSLSVEDQPNPSYCLRFPSITHCAGGPISFCEGILSGCIASGSLAALEGGQFLTHIFGQPSGDVLVVRSSR